MRPATRLTLVLAMAAVSACTLVVRDPGKTDGGTGTPSTIVPRRAAMLWLVNLDPSAVNLAGAYEGLIRQFEVALASQRSTPIVVDRLGVMALNRRLDVGARLFYGESKRGAVIEPRLAKELSPELLQGVNAGALAEAITKIAGSRLLDDQDPNRAEQGTLAELAASLGTETVYDVAGSNVEGVPLIPEPPEILIIGTLTHLARACETDAAQCRLQGAPPADFFTAADHEGAIWVRFAGGAQIAPERIFHVSFVTAEKELPTAFYARCGNTPGFPQGLVDVIEPSQLAYYGPLADGVNEAFPGRYRKDDLCSLLGTSRVARLVAHASAIAGEVAALR